MTITVDALGANANTVLPQTQIPGVNGDSCGEGINWQLGFQGLSRMPRRIPTSSSPLLIRVIEGEIIPRLLLTHRDASSQAPKPEDLADLAKSDTFARMVLESEAEQIVEVIERLRERGITPARIFLDLLGPIARKLGEFWEEDRCTFTEVTLGLSTLHQVVHEISRRNGGDPPSAASRRAYFVPAPGEQHTFGVCMLTEFFLHAGWQTACDHDASKAVILRTVETQNIDIIGFSISSPELIAPLRELILKTRAASLNRNLGVIIGGRLFSDSPELTSAFDTLAVPSDAVNAVHAAESLLGRLPRVDEAQKRDAIAR